MTNHDNFLMRAKDWGLLVLILTVLGIVGSFYRRTAAWDDTVVRMSQMEISQNSQDIQIAILRTELEEINHNLEKISHQIERIK